MKPTSLLAGLLAMAAAAPVFSQPQPQDPPKFKEVELDVLILKNGNRIVGIIAGSNEDEVIMRVKAGLIGVRKEHIERRDKEILRVRIEPPPQKPVEPKVPVIPVKPPDKPPETPPTTPDVKFPDPDPELREKIKAVLIKMMQGTDADRQAAIDELAKTGGAGQIYLVAGLVSEPRLAPWLLAAIQRQPETDGLPYLMNSLPKLPIPVQASVITVLGARNYKDALELIAGYLSNPSAELRGAAVTALGQMGATQYFSPLVQLLGAEDNALAQQVQQALELLAKGPGMREVATVELTQVLDKGTGRARVGAALVCGRLQLKEAVPSLLYLIDDASPDVRANVAIALGDMRATEAVAPLTNRLVLEKDRWTKIQIIQAFEKIADKSTIPSLIDLLDDEDAQVRSRASNVLTNITRQRFGEDKSLWRDWWEKSGGGH